MNIVTGLALVNALVVMTFWACGSASCITSTFGIVSAFAPEPVDSASALDATTTIGVHSTTALRAIAMTDANSVYTCVPKPATSAVRNARDATAHRTSTAHDHVSACESGNCQFVSDQVKGMHKGKDKGSVADDRGSTGLIGEMETKTNTVAPATHKEQVSMHHAVEKVQPANVLVMPEIECGLPRRRAQRSQLARVSRRHQLRLPHCVQATCCIQVPR
jgi:hypothetical protein